MVGDVRDKQMQSIVCKMLLFLSSVLLCSVAVVQPRLIVRSAGMRPGKENNFKTYVPGAGKSFLDYMEETPQAANVYYDDTEIEHVRKFKIPKKKKLFHEHFEDFLSLIAAESATDIYRLVGAYQEFQAFLNTWEFLKARKFSQLLKELKKVREFEALIIFLDSDDIDVFKYLDRFEQMFEDLEVGSSSSKISGNDFNAFLRDVISVLPVEKLAKLFEEKMATDANFRNGFLDVSGEEVVALVAQLMSSHAFQMELQTLAQNGIDVQLVFQLLKTMLGVH